MKKKIVLIILMPVLFLFACNSLKIGEYKEINEEINFKVDKIQLTKSFQKIEPYAELKPKSSTDNQQLKLIVSAGLFESSGLEINKIIRKNNDLNIYINNLYDDKSNLAVPQAIISIHSKDVSGMENMQINIINEDSKPISLKISLNDAISIAESQFKLSSISTPKISIFEDNEENFIWNIDYRTVFEKSKDTFSLISLETNIDANSGKVISYDKNKISDTLDYGNIIGVFKDRYLAYKKISDGGLENKENKEELWYFDSLTNEKLLLFSSEFQLSNPHVSPNSMYLSFIESTDSGSSLYIIPENGRQAYKVSTEKNINPIMHSWIDNNNICLVEHNKSKSNLFKYNIKTNDLESFITLPKRINNISVEKNQFLFLEENDNDINKDIYITSDFKDYSLIGKGNNPKFLNNKTIVYMEKKEKQEENALHIYDIKNSQIKFEFEGLIPNYQIVDHNTIFYPIKSDKNNNYILSRYNYLDDSIVEVNKCITSKAFFNRRQNLYYINLNSPIESDNNMIIYTIKLK